MATLKKFKKEAITVSTLISEMLEELIRTNAFTQRYDDNWAKKMKDALVSSVLNENYIPPLIFAEVEKAGMVSKYIVDGLQRSTTLSSFKLGIFKLGKNVEDNIVTYNSKVKEEDGRISRDENGEIIWEEREYDIAGKSFDQLPKELQQRFDKYLMDAVVYQDCTMEDVTKLIRILNNHSAMNVSQNALTYAGTFAQQIKDIENKDFFLNHFSSTLRTKGHLQGIIMDAVMLIFHPDNWKSNAARQATALNNLACNQDFDYIEELNKRLYDCVDGTTEFAFTKKNTSMWLKVMHIADLHDIKDSQFMDFLREFNSTLKHKQVEYNGEMLAFSDLDKSYSPEKEIPSKYAKQSKDRLPIMRKVDIIKTLMFEYCGVEESESAEEVVLETEEIVTEVENEVVEVVAETEETTDSFEKFYNEISKLDTVFCTGNERDICERVSSLYKGELEDLAFYANCVDDFAKNISDEAKVVDKDNLPALIVAAETALSDDSYSEHEFIKWLVWFSREDESKLHGSDEDRLLQIMNSLVAFWDMRQREVA